MKKTIVFVGSLLLLAGSAWLAVRGYDFPALWIIGGLLAVVSGLTMMGSDGSSEKDDERYG